MHLSFATIPTSSESHNLLRANKIDSVLGPHSDQSDRLPTTRERHACRRLANTLRTEGLLLEDAEVGESGRFRMVDAPHR